MSDSIKIQIKPNLNINSVNKDKFIEIELEENINTITEYDVNNIINSYIIFDAERQNTKIYRIHGGVEYLSILNGIKSDYSMLSDFFENKNNDYLNIYWEYQHKTLFNSLDFYLLKPATGYTKIGDTNDNITYIKNYEVIATPDNFEIFKGGYSKNIYNEEKFLFNINKDIDISTYLDGFEIPIDEVYIYWVYKPVETLNESMRMTKWDETTKDIYYEDFTPTDLNIGDIVYGDKIEYSKYSLTENLIEEQKYFINTPYDNLSLDWVYRPLIPIKLRYFSNEIKRYNVSGATYNTVNNIPYYATDIGGGNMIWRDILPQGYIDPLTGIGVNYPFVNKRRYLYTNIILSMSPNLNHTNTYNVFKEIKFEDPINVNYKPLNDDIANTDKPC